MNTMTHLSQDDLALFALQLLEGEELENAIQHLERCEQCRQEVARFQGDLVGYALAQSELHTPPAAARERLMRRVAKEKKIALPVAVPRPAEPARAAVASLPAYEHSSASVPVAQPIPLPQERPATDTGELFLASRGRRIFESEPEEVEETRHGRNPVVSILGWTGWAIAAGMAVVAGLQFRERQSALGDLAAQQVKTQSVESSLTEAQTTLDTLTDAGAMQVSLHMLVNGQPEPPKPEGHAAYIAGKGSLVFIASHLQPIDPNKTYQLWLLPADGQNPVPAGTFRPDSRGIATVVMPEIPKGIAAKGFGVTVEEQGGSKTPTPPIILAGM
ncbi:MAG: anti-sigma factor [Acidobacteriaceae bacterium]|nr:anti-sigma factor [Acidobacteriaceae bacterium]